MVRTLSDGMLVPAWIARAGHELRIVAIADRGLGHALAPVDGVSLALRPQDVHLIPR